MQAICGTAVTMAYAGMMARNSPFLLKNRACPIVILMPLRLIGKAIYGLALLTAGVSKFDGNSFTNFGTAEGLAHKTVWDIMEDKEGGIWIATRGGLTYYDGESF